MLHYYDLSKQFTILTTSVLMSERSWITTTRRCWRSIRSFVSCGEIPTEEMVCLLLWCIYQFVKWLFTLLLSLCRRA